MSSCYDDETGGHGGDLKRALRRFDLDQNRLLDFSSNINPLGPPPGLLAHLRRVLPEITAYPTPQARELREALSAYFHVPPSSLMVGNGANELIHLLMLWKRPQRVLVPAPTFSEYERAALLCGARVERFPLPPGEPLDAEAVGAKLGNGDLVVVCNPGNPTGTLYRQAELTVLMRNAEERGAAVMVDESFIPLTGHPEESVRGWVGEHLWVVQSLTKLWGLPGLRLGCLIGPEKELGELTRLGDPWRVNLLAQEAGTYCLQHDGYLGQALALVERERLYLTRRLRAMGCFQVFDGAANYLLVRGLDPQFQVEVFAHRLAARGVLVRRADNFHGLNERYFRIAVRKRAENRRLLDEIKCFLQTDMRRHDRARNGGD